MRIEAIAPAFERVYSDPPDSISIQAANREVIQAVRSVNQSDRVGDPNEMTFSLDRRTRQPVITIVDRRTREASQTIPNETVLRLAKVSNNGVMER